MKLIILIMTFSK